MERCWKYYPDNRADIFEMVVSLREAVAENNRLEQQAVSNASM
jgi:hypothetical protein